MYNIEIQKSMTFFQRLMRKWTSRFMHSFQTEVTPEEITSVQILLKVVTLYFYKSRHAHGLQNLQAMHRLRTDYLKKSSLYIIRSKRFT